MSVTNGSHVIFYSFFSKNFILANDITRILLLKKGSERTHVQNHKQCCFQIFVIYAFQKYLVWKSGNKINQLYMFSFDAVSLLFFRGAIFPPKMMKKVENLFLA